MIDSNIRIIVAENSDLYRIGLRALFAKHDDIDLIAETNNLHDLCQLASNLKPDVILVDWILIESNSTIPMIDIENALSCSKTLIFSEHIDSNLCSKALNAGASGVMEKFQSSGLLLKIINSVYGGQNWFPHDRVRNNASLQIDSDHAENQPSMVAASVLGKLSNGECKVAYLASIGLSAKEISEQLCITEKAVRNRLSIIYRKLGITNKIQLCLKFSSITHHQ